MGFLISALSSRLYKPIELNWIETTRLEFFKSQLALIQFKIFKLKISEFITIFKMRYLDAFSE